MDRDRRQAACMIFSRAAQWTAADESAMHALYQAAKRWFRVMPIGDAPRDDLRLDARVADWLESLWSTHDAE